MSTVNNCVRSEERKFECIGRTVVAAWLPVPIMPLPNLVAGGSIWIGNQVVYHLLWNINGFLWQIPSDDVQDGSILKNLRDHPSAEVGNLRLNI